MTGTLAHLFKRLNREAEREAERVERAPTLAALTVVEEDYEDENKPSCCANCVEERPDLKPVMRKNARGAKVVSWLCTPCRTFEGFARAQMRLRGTEEVA